MFRPMAAGGRRPSLPGMFFGETRRVYGPPVLVYISCEMSCASLTFRHICAIIYYRNDVLAVTAYMTV